MAQIGSSRSGTQRHIRAIVTQIADSQCMSLERVEVAVLEYEARRLEGVAGGSGPACPVHAVCSIENTKQDGRDVAVVMVTRVSLAPYAEITVILEAKGKLASTVRLPVALTDSGFRELLQHAVPYAMQVAASSMVDLGLPPSLTAPPWEMASAVAEALDRTVG